MLGNVSATQWRWVIQALSAEIDDKPVVEPEPEDREDNNAGFQSWLDYVASQTALIVRNYSQIDAAELQPWHIYLQGELERVEQQWQQLKSETEDEATLEFGKAIISLIQGLLALASGESVENVLPQVLPPFNQIIRQAGQVAQQPVWHHPGCSPIDFLVEQAAQKAVEVLRIQDEWRSERLARMALRYKLMNLDIQKEESLQEIARFLDELQKLVLADGKTLPVAEPPLQPPFAAILNAIFEAGAVTNEN